MMGHIDARTHTHACTFSASCCTKAGAQAWGPTGQHSRYGTAAQMSDLFVYTSRVIKCVASWLVASMPCTWHKAAQSQENTQAQDGLAGAPGEYTSTRWLGKSACGRSLEPFCHLYGMCAMRARSCVVHDV
eukprot:1106880-Pelagomonas_calceolata.AAC.2